MYICYLDESGSPEITAQTTHFILLGLAIPADTWKAKDGQVSTIKAGYGLENAEVHTAWMARDYPEQARVPAFDQLDRESRRKAVLGVRAMNLARPMKNSKAKSLLKSYRETEAYVHLTRRERRACLLALASLISSWKDARLFAEAQDKQRVQPQDPFSVAFEQVVTRFNTYLGKFDRNGIMVQDNNKTVASRLTHTMRRFHREGTLFTTVDKIIETPLFVDSQLTEMVQLADLCAYATRRYFERGEKDLFTPIYKTFDRQAGRLVGLRHYTGSFKCKCKICLHHGRYDHPRK